MGLFNDIELDDLELTGPRLLLRRWRSDDAERVHAIMHDRSMFDFLVLPDPYTREAATAFVTELGHEGRGDGTGLGCAVVERDSGRVVGSAALRVSRDYPEIGYWVAPDARGRGYAAEVTGLLADFGLEQGLDAVWVFCDVRNLGSAHTALRAGFRFEGVLRGRAPAAARGPGDMACFGRTAADAPGPVAPAFPPLPTGGLRDGVITLRVIAPDDAAELAETDDDVAVAIGFGGPRRTAREEQAAADRAGLNWLTGTAASLAIVDDATGALAGAVTLRKGGPPGVGGIGYVVHPLFRGRGYTTRALRLLSPWALGVGFVRLELGAKVENVASQRAALSAGFEPDGVRRQRLRNVDGTFSDEARFALLAPTPLTTATVAAGPGPDPAAAPE